MKEIDACHGSKHDMALWNLAKVPSLHAYTQLVKNGGPARSVEILDSLVDFLLDLLATIIAGVVYFKMWETFCCFPCGEKHVDEESIGVPFVVFMG